MSDRTLVLLKPDTVERGLVGEVLQRLEAKGLTIAAMDLRTLDADTLARHYEEHVGKGFYGDLVAFMSRGPVVAMVLEGPEDTWEVVRTLVGATEEESRPIFAFLNRHATAYERTYRHRWHVDDLTMWDNRCLVHAALSDYDTRNEPREMWRSGMLGPKTGESYKPEELLEPAGAAG